MNDSQELQEISRNLYQYLSDYVVGSEKVVCCRRLFFHLFDEFYNINEDCNPEKIFSSGSKAEGLLLPGSDLDLMYMMRNGIVYQEQESCIQGLYMDATYTQPCFVILKTENVGLSPKQDQKIIKSKDFKDDFLSYSGLYKELKENSKNELPFPISDLMKYHGPSLYCPVFDTDLVLCLKFNSWPKIANRFLHRSSISEWPTNSVIQEIYNQGVLLVPVGSTRTTSHNTDCAVWRISFSMPEKILINSFNHVQLVCYALLKIYLKEIIDKIEGLYKKLCSYYIKTLLFWILEEIPSSVWIPENLLKCFRCCIQRLQYWITYNYIPHYFIPEYNMIEERISPESRKKLSLILDNVLRRDGWKNIIKAETLKNFSPDKMTHISIDELDAGLIPLHTLVFMNVFVKHENLLEKCFQRILNGNLSKCTRNIYAVYYIYVNRILALKSGQRCLKVKSNKADYQYHGKCLPHILLSTFSDAVSGWLFLVAFFYRNKEFTKMNLVLSHILDVLKDDLFLIEELNPIKYRDWVTRKPLYKSKPFLKRMRREIIREVHWSNTDEKATTDLYFDLTLLNPIVGVHFYTFLYYNYVGDTLRIQESLNDLKNAVNAIPHENLLQRLISNLVLLEAEEKSGNDISCCRENLLNLFCQFCETIFNLVNNN